MLRAERHQHRHPRPQRRAHRRHRLTEAESISRSKMMRVWVRSVDHRRGHGALTAEPHSRVHPTRVVPRRMTPVQAATSAAQLLGPPVSFGLRVARVKILMLSSDARLSGCRRWRWQAVGASAGAGRLLNSAAGARSGAARASRGGRRLRLLCPAFLRAFLREWSSALHVPCSTRMDCRRSHRSRRSSLTLVSPATTRGWAGQT